MKLPIITTLLLLGTAGALSTPLPQKGALARSVTLTTSTQTSLQSALTTLTRAAGINLVAQGLPNVTVTQNLRNVPAFKAITTLLEVYAPELDAKLDNGNLLIAPRDVIARIGNSGSRTNVIYSLGLQGTQITALKSVAPGLDVIPFSDTVTILNGTKSQLDAARNLLTETVAMNTSPYLDKTVDLPVAPLDAQNVTTILKAAYPDLTVTAANTRVILSGDERLVDKAKDVLARLQADERERIANLPKPVEPVVVPPAPVVVVPPPPPVLQKRTEFRLADTTVARVVQASGNGVQARWLDGSMYLLTGTEEAITDVTTTLRALEANQANLMFVPYPVRGAGQEISTALQNALPGVSISFAPGNQQILVHAGANDHARVAALLRQLDPPLAVKAADSSTEIITEILHLQYARAADLAPLLSATATPPAAPTPQAAADQATTAATPTPAAPPAPTGTPSASDTTPAATPALAAAPNQPAAPVLQVKVEPRLNALVFQGPRKAVEEARQIAKSLDTELPNVNVALNVQQVDNSDGRDLGLKWEAGVAGVTVGGGSSGLSVALNPTAAAPRFKVDLNASQSSGKSKTLLDTTISTQSGRPGVLTSGGSLTVPRKSVSGTGENQTTTVTTETYSYGLEIRVLPRLAADGKVELTVTTIIGQRPVEGASGSIDIAKQQIDTIITLNPGEQVTLGGIITDIESQSQRGVPGLSKVPLVGNLFGESQKGNRSAVLLITLKAEGIRKGPARTAAGEVNVASGVTRTLLVTDTAAASAAAAASTVSAITTSAPTLTPVVSTPAPAAPVNTQTAHGGSRTYIAPPTTPTQP